MSPSTRNILLVDSHPDLLLDWDYDRNSTIDVNEVIQGSHKKVWWRGRKCGHTWFTAIRNRAARGGECPYCSNRKLLIGFNDLQTINPKLASEWHPTKNGTLTPRDVFQYTNKKVWWICSQKHEWETTINGRSECGCPYCSGRNAIRGETDLATTHPEVCHEWDLEKNIITSSEIKAGADKIVWWLCDLGHSYDMDVYSKVKKQSGCPICSGHRVLEGFNDLGTTNPKLALDWHPTKNGDLTPKDFTQFSNKKVWWICPRGHSWKINPCEKNRSIYGCSQCAAGTQSSIGEKDLAALVRNNLPTNITVETSYRLFKSQGIAELDIYIPEKNIAIEFNGLYWHSDIFKKWDYHREKYILCKSLGIELIQIWEDDHRNRPEIVKRMILHKLGASKETSIYARKTKAAPISLVEAAHLLNHNHIQGSAVKAPIRLGLKTADGELVAVAIFKKYRKADNSYELVRYATNKSVVGGLGKLLSYFIKSFNPSYLITYADHCISSGNLYEKTGFTIDKIMPLNYSFYSAKRGNCRIDHRKLTKDRFLNDPSLSYTDGLSSIKLARENGYHVIWDAGKTRYRLNV